MMRLGSYVHPLSTTNGIYRFWDARDAKGFKDFYDIFEQHKIWECAGQIRKIKRKKRPYIVGKRYELLVIAG
jgi:hypothetical protein